MRAALVLISSLAAGFVAAQDFGTVAACGQTCFNDMKPKIAGCAPDNQKCHCDAPDYRNGLRDCVAQACAAADVPLVQNSLTAYVDGVCNAAAAAPAPAPSTSAAPSPSPAATTPPPPPPASSTSAPPPATTAPISSSTSPAPAPVSSSSSATPVGEAPAASTSHSSSSTSSSSSASGTSSAPAAATTTAEAKSDRLSGATVAGIAIGGSAVALGLIGVLVCVVLHRQHRRNGGDQGNNMRLNISQPMPGSGRSYAGDHHNEKYEMNASLEDFKSRRYEDMLPRQTPRTMV